MENIEELAEMMKALSDPTRLRLLRLLAQPETGESAQECCGGRQFLCVNACADMLGVSQSAISQHLRVLRAAKLVRGIRQGRFMHYVPDADGLEKVRQVFMDVLPIEGS
jgi:DNA-binding transcriptional ArsR family regulator